MSYKHGQFVWFELVTPDVDKALAFYPEVIGFGTQDMDMGDFVYNMLTRGDKAQAGVTRPQSAPEKISIRFRSGEWW